MYAKAAREPCQGAIEGGRHAQGFPRALLNGLELPTYQNEAIQRLGRTGVDLCLAVGAFLSQEAKGQ